MMMLIDAIACWQHIQFSVSVSVSASVSVSLSVFSIYFHRYSTPFSPVKVKSTVSN